MFYPCLTNNDHLLTPAKRWVGDVTTMNQKQDNAEGTSEIKLVKSEQEKTGKYKPVWESLESRPMPDWYDDAKVGVFMHWGVYSVPSYTAPNTRGYAEWFWMWWHLGKTRNFDECLEHHTAERCERIRKAAESVQVYMEKTYPKTFHYTDFAPKFTAEFFNPDEWTEILKASGAK